MSASAANGYVLPNISQTVFCENSYWSVAPSEKRFRADTRSLLVFQNIRRFQSAPIESERGFKVPPIEIHFETGIPITPVYVISYLMY